MDDFNQWLLTHLRQNYQFENFRPGQQEVLTHLLYEQRDVLAVLPTGTGKSLIYQIAGQVLGGLTVIVSPLISLMQDQVARLNAQGNKRAVALNSMQGYKVKQVILENLTQFDYLFIAPETLMQENVLAKLVTVDIHLLVIDEAHSIAQWGPDFRPDYLQLGQLYHKFKMPRLLLLTATAGTDVKQALHQQFTTPLPLIEVTYSVNRANIHLRTETLPNEKLKQQRLIALVDFLPGAGIVYLSSKKQANQLTQLLRSKTTARVATYHGDVENEQRFAIQQQFMHDQIDIIVATSAFGMGIDKNDIRWVIHYHLANDLESYLQEIGRAGRDQKPAIAILLYTENDNYLVNNLLLSGLPDQMTIQHFYKQTPNYVFEPQHLRLLEYYRTSGLDENQVTNLFVKRLRFKQVALQKMLHYIKLETNKRNYLITAFNEAPLTGENANNWSTQVTELETLALNLPEIKRMQQMQNEVWQTRLLKLFNQKQ